MKTQMKIKDGNFSDVLEKVRNENEEGIVLLGAGGDLQEWIKGITDVLKKEGIVSKTDSSEDLWDSPTKLVSTGGRTDLVLYFKGKFDMGKMAMWRLRMGDCSWVSDFVVNYAKHYGYANQEEDHVAIDNG